MRASEKRQARNKSVRSRCKTNITKAERLIFTGDIEEARKAVVTAISSLDKAAEKGILHPNNTARRKARLMKKLNAAHQSITTTETPSEPEAEPEAEPAAEPEE